MGRHSAVDDDDTVDTVDAVEAAVVVESPAPAGRHGRHVRGEDSRGEDGRREDSEATGPLRASGIRDLEIRDLEKRAAVEDHQPTEPLAAVESVPADPDASPAPAAAKRRPRGSQSTAADLALLRRRADVRNRVIAAVVVPFVLYVAVMLLIGAAGGQYLLWVWIPLVSAGVGGGLILDTAHRKHPADDAS